MNLDLPTLTFKTLEEAQNYVKAGVLTASGVYCPCCGQKAKVYSRKLNSTIAHGLIHIDKYFKQNPHTEWVHMLNLFTRLRICKTNEGALLAHWGLIEAKEGEKEDGNPHVGLWKITENGKKFVAGRLLMPEKVILYDGRVLGFSEKKAHIIECLGKKFNYDELMSPVIADNISASLPNTSSPH